MSLISSVFPVLDYPRKKGNTAETDANPKTLSCGQPVVVDRLSVRPQPVVFGRATRCGQGRWVRWVHDQLGPNHAREAKKRGLSVVGYFASGDETKFSDLLKSQKDAGARHINVQLADHDTTPDDALRLTLRLLEEADRIGEIEPAVEVHRDTCTETPEKTYALADGYLQETGKLLPMTWDFSHLSVVKHLSPENYIERLLIRPDLIQRSIQFHFRPFNGHHCQVPVTRGDGTVTKELSDWLPFVRATIDIWLGTDKGKDRTMIVVPEMGPVKGGYNFEQLPNSWEEAIRLRSMLDQIWREAVV